MKAYKGFNKDLTCLGYQFKENELNETDKANCAANGFHCAENPLDCLNYYPDWKNSVYYVVEATGDLDEDAIDSKISCTKMRLIRKLSLYELLLEAIIYIVRHPERKWNSYVSREFREASGGFAVVRGKNPCASGKIGDIIVLLKETEKSQAIVDVSIFTIDGIKNRAGVWYDVFGKESIRNECIMNVEKQCVF